MSRFHASLTWVDIKCSRWTAADTRRTALASAQACKKAGTCARTSVSAAQRSTPFALPRVCTYTRTQTGIEIVGLARKARRLTCNALCTCAAAHRTYQEHRRTNADGSQEELLECADRLWTLQNGSKSNDGAGGGSPRPCACSDAVAHTHPKARSSMCE